VSFKKKDRNLNVIPKIEVKSELTFEELMKKALNTSLPKKEKKGKKK
jgi:hypothetical protein